MNCVQDGDKKFVWRNRRALGEKEVAFKRTRLLLNPLLPVLDMSCTQTNLHSQETSTTATSSAAAFEGCPMGNSSCSLCCGWYKFLF